LRDRMANKGQREAFLAWLVAGGVRWYQAEKVMPALPARVQADIEEWRGETDLILRFIGEHLVFDDMRAVLVTELYDGFIAWLKAGGFATLNVRTFTPRFGKHPLVKQHGVKAGTVKGHARLSRLFSDAVPESNKAWTGVALRNQPDLYALYAFGTREPRKSSAEGARTHGEGFRSVRL